MRLLPPLPWLSSMKLYTSAPFFLDIPKNRVLYFKRVIPLSTAHNNYRKDKTAMRLREISNTDGRLLGRQELQAYTNTGRASAEKLAAAAGAVLKIGGRTLYDRAKIDAYIDAELSRQQASV